MKLILNIGTYCNGFTNVLIIKKTCSVIKGFYQIFKFESRQQNVAQTYLISPFTFSAGLIVLYSFFLFFQLFKACEELSKNAKVAHDEIEKIKNSANDLCTKHAADATLAKCATEKLSTTIEESLKEHLFSYCEPPLHCSLRCCFVYMADLSAVNTASV